MTGASIATTDKADVLECRKVELPSIDSSLGNRESVARPGEWIRIGRSPASAQSGPVQPGPRRVLAGVLRGR